MKRFSIFLCLVFSIVYLSSCKTTVQTPETIVYKDSTKGQEVNQLTIEMIKGESYNHPTFVIWKEDMNGNYIETIFITKSYASGIYGHEMIGDSVWRSTSGSSNQPAALPYWTYKKGKIDDKAYVPTPDNPFVDAYTGATPSQNFKFETGVNSSENSYRILFEINQTADWNHYWTNNKFPDSPAYKNSAQPSIIYAVSINSNDSEFYMNPIGHGDPKGESGKLFTDLSTLTTVKEILASVKIEFNR